MVRPLMVDDWRGLYGEGWGKALVPEAFEHPAKVRPALARRIYAHMLEEGWVEAGDDVVDPFAGIGGFALHAMRAGLHFTGVELEERFIKTGSGHDCPGFTAADWRRFAHRAKRLGRWCPRCERAMGDPGEGRIVPSREAHRYHGNLDVWGGLYANRWNTWGSARLLRGDSRRLLAVLAEAGQEETRGSCNVLQVDTHPNQCYNPAGGECNGKIQIAASGRTMEIVQRGKTISAGDSGQVRMHTESSSSKTEESRVQDEKLVGGASVSIPNRKTQADKCNRPGSLGVEGRQRAEGLQEKSTEREMRSLREPSELGDTSQRFRPLQQSSRQPTDSLCELSSASTQASLLEGNQRGKRNTKIKRPSGMEQIRAVVSSPPYTGNIKSDYGVEDRDVRRLGADFKGRGRRSFRGSENYGDGPGQLGRMPDAGFDAAVSSPPFADSCAGRGTDELTQSKGLGADYDERLQYDERGFLMGPEKYEEWVNSCNLGSFRNVTETFWQAARQVVEQVYMALAPGAHAVWVVKRFVRDGEIVEFSQQWAELCEIVGFRIVHWHRAMLVEDKGAQYDLFGNLHRKTVKRTSFFRRLYESKHPENSIDWEDVICMER